MIRKSVNFPEPLHRDIDCGPTPDLAILYDSTTGSTRPTIANGQLIFGGSKSLGKVDTITNLDLSINAASIDFHSILRVRRITCQSALNKRVRYKCCEPGVGGDTVRQNIYVSAFTKPTCDQPRERLEFQWVAVATPDESDCCSMLHQIADIINRDDQQEKPIRAEVQPNNTDIDFIGIDGVNYELVVSGLKGAATIVPFYEGRLTTKKMLGWFPEDLYDACTADECLEVIEIVFNERRPSTNNPAVPTSDSNTDVNTYDTVRSLATIVFDGSANAIASRDALITLLTQTGNPLHGKLPADFNSPAFNYSWVIAREDAGDDTALAAARADYGTAVGVIVLDRVYYEKGVSFYQALTATDTPLTPEDGDEITPGSFSAYNLECHTRWCPVEPAEQWVAQAPYVTDCIDGFTNVQETLVGSDPAQVRWAPTEDPCTDE